MVDFSQSREVVISSGSTQLAPGLEPQNVLVVALPDIGTEQLYAYRRESFYPVAAQDYAKDLVGGVYPYTPTITALAEGGTVEPQDGSDSVGLLNGVRFSQARGAMGGGSASLAQLLTGRYGWRTGITAPVSTETASARAQGIQDSRTLFDFARAARYPAGFFGTWGLDTPGRDQESLFPASTTFSGLGFGGPTSIGLRDGLILFHETDGPTPADAFGAASSLPPTPRSWFSQEYESGMDGFTVAQFGGDEAYADAVTAQAAATWINSQSGPWCAVWAPSSLTDDTGPPTGLVSTTYTDGSLYQDTSERLEAIDALLGNLLSAISGQLDRTFVVVTSLGASSVSGWLAVAQTLTDIGTTYQGATGGTRFSSTEYDAQSRVPLIIHHSGLVKTTRESTVAVDAVDVFDFVRDIMGIQRSRFGDDYTTDGKLGLREIICAATADVASVEGRWTASQRPTPYGELTPLLGFTRPADYSNGETVVRSIVHSLDGLGQFRFVRVTAGTETQRENLYQLRDTAGDHVDPFELTDLGTTHAAYRDMRLAFEAYIEEIDA